MNQPLAHQVTQATLESATWMARYFCSMAAVPGNKGKVRIFQRELTKTIQAEGENFMNAYFNDVSRSILERLPPPVNKKLVRYFFVGKEDWLKPSSDEDFLREQTLGGEVRRFISMMLIQISNLQDFLDEGDEPNKIIILNEILELEIQIRNIVQSREQEQNVENNVPQEVLQSIRIIEEPLLQLLNQ